MSKILTIQTGLNASVGLFVNGIATFCIQEERLNREKNFGGIPKKSMTLILEKHVMPAEIEAIIFTNSSSFTISKKNYNNYYSRIFLDAIKLNKRSKTHRTIKSKLKKTWMYGMLPKEKVKEKIKEHSWLKAFNLNEAEIYYVDHHLCHASAVYYGMAPSTEQKYLVMTLDGGGDGVTSSVSIGHNGNLKNISESSCYSIGNMYSAITYFLGFNPHEHEYKLMGLSPYVSPEYSEKYSKFFTKYLDINKEGQFYNPTELSHAIFFSDLLEKFKKDRFDNIAAGLQLFTERIIGKWIEINIKLHGISNLLCSGGVFMNVKSNQNISKKIDVKYLDVFPSCGDETNIFGAAYHYHNNIKTIKKKEVQLLSQFTLGTEGIENFTEAVEKFKSQIEITQHENIAKYMAVQLANNKILARCSGQMEFGARALGNRSILAKPSLLANVNKINKAIKKRDFWMPFAPLVLEEDVGKYFIVPDSLKKQLSPYMMFAFDSLSNWREEIICGLHQADFTGRAQTIGKKLYPEIHLLLDEFKKLTGSSVLLNTSFNLHGFPIVNDAADAIEVLLNSEIDELIIENTSIRKLKKD